MAAGQAERNLKPQQVAGAEDSDQLIEDDQESAEPSNNNTNDPTNEEELPDAVPAAASGSTEEQIPRQPAPSISEQKRIITELRKGEILRVNDAWYLIAVGWWRAWKAYVHYDRKDMPEDRADIPTSPNPGEINNSNLVVPTSANLGPDLVKIHKHVREQADYVLVREDVWKQLYAWYGGGPAIRRYVVEEGIVFMKRIELHPYFLQIALYKPKKELQYVEMPFRKSDTIADVKEAAAKYFGVDEFSETRLWRMHMDKYQTVYGKHQEGRELDVILFRDIGEKFVLEVQGEDGKWPLEPASDTTADPAQAAAIFTGGSRATTSVLHPYRSTAAAAAASSSSGYSSLSTSSRVGGLHKPGLCGLQNLGNTCFMNSALQCLTKTPQLRDFFLSKKYLEDINPDNPLGAGGRLAESFAHLMREIWSGEHSYYSPREFKHMLGKFAPQFSGYAQQDSQELLAYLLDGLHEDLNRVKKKPLTEPVESNGRPDDVVAKEAWDVHLLRNDSIIVDKFQGQLKSTLECPNCGNISITFDPFMYLSLPLPTERTRLIEATVFRFGNPAPPIKYGIKVSKLGFIREFREKLAEKCGGKASHFVIADVFHNKIYKTLPDKEQNTAISDSDTIFAYEVPGLEDAHHKSYDSYSYSLSPAETPQPPFINVRIFTKEKQTGYYRNSFSYRSVAIGVPFILPFELGKTTKKDLYDMCLEFVRRYLKDDIKEKWGVDLSAPETLFPAPKIKKQRMESEEVTSMDTSDQEASSDNIFSLKSNNTTTSMDTTSSSIEKGDTDIADDELKKTSEVAGQEEEKDATEQQQHYLFTLKFDSASGMSLDDSGDLSLPYSDELVTKSEYSEGSYGRKSLSMYIDPEVLDAVVDKQKFEQVVEDESVSEGKEVSKTVALDDCLQLFTTKEKLGPDDSWYCPKCKEFVQATKQFDIWSVPEVLVVHLKRFQYNRYHRDKLETKVNYPLNGWDLSKTVQKGTQHLGDTKPIYNLYAISNHYGGLGGGHYTAFAKEPGTGKWHKYDDSFVSEVDAESVQANKAAYVLFYQLAKPNQDQQEQEQEQEQDQGTAAETTRTSTPPTTTAMADIDDLSGDNDDADDDKPRGYSTLENEVD